MLLPLLALLATHRVAPQVGLAHVRGGAFNSVADLRWWRETTYGPSPAITVTRAAAHSGGGGLQIEATSPTDCAVAQDVAVRPYALYRLTAWVRTTGLRTVTGRICGAVQVQVPGGGAAASSPSARGTTDWHQVALWFRAPGTGSVHVALFLAGFGTGVGKACFDEIELTEVVPSMDPIVVERELITDHPISPLQYGQFVEYLCTLVPAMWAEKLYDGSFEGLTPYKFVYLKEKDFQEKPWYPAGATNRSVVEQDPGSKIGGAVSERIRSTGAAPCEIGIAQDGLAVQRAVPCRMSIWARADTAALPVRVTIHDGSTTLASWTFVAGADWAKHETTLRYEADAANATISILFTGPATLWLDSASLMPTDAIGGWRKDVVEAVRALHCGVIRFGGSALDDPNLGDFEWSHTVGDPDRRAPFQAWGGLQPAGAGLEELVQFIQAVGAEPLICVRTRDRTAADAAAEVEYFNGPTTSPMGARRAANGHPKPYGIRYWQVGNERSGDAYERLLPEFARAMKAADPAIVLMASYPTPGVLSGAGQLLDYVCPHQYDVADLAGAKAELDATRQMIADAGLAGRVRVGVTEWNTTAGDAGPNRAKLWTLENALKCARYQNLLHREADLVDIANRSNLINSFCSGIVQTDRYRLYKTPTYFMQEMYATLAGTHAVQIGGAVPADVAPDLSATLSADRRTITLFAVNDGLTAITRVVDVSAWATGAVRATVTTLADHDSAGMPDVTNSFDRPDRVSPSSSTADFKDGHATMTFPPLSLTVIAIPIGR